MKIVIVEDRPWKLKESIKKIRQNGITLNDVVYVGWDREKLDNETKESLEKMKEDIDGLNITITDNMNFSTQMQEFYQQPDFFILCDFNLTGDDREYFEKRVNVSFAKAVMQDGKPSPRIWFYTTAGETTNEQINNAFPGRNISVTTMHEGQVILDIEEIKDAIQNLEK